MSKQLCKCGKEDWERAVLGPTKNDWGITCTTWRYCKQCLYAAPHEPQDDEAAYAIMAGVR